MSRVPAEASDVLVVWTTCPDVATARRIAEAVVDERLAACGNIVPGLTSIYRWKGAIEDARECLLIFKTAAAGWPALEARLMDLHPYDVPELLAFSAERGSPSYVAWVVEESGGGA